MAHIGKEKDRIELTVKYLRSVKYETHYTYYGEINYIHIFETEDGDKLIWKTGKSLVLNETGDSRDWVFPNEGAVIRIKATVKEHSDYNGEPQTIVTRLSLLEIVKQGKSYEEIEEEKRVAKEKKIQEQLASIQDGDEVIEMDYRQYKNHYADCETIIDSYDADTRMVSVIVREGRMKNSGVRGKRFSQYLINIDGIRHGFKAVCEANAIKQAKKLFKDAESFEVVETIRPRSYYL